MWSLGALAVAWTLSASAADLPPPASGPIDFGKDIQPIFRRSCYQCHGPDKQKNEFRLDRKTAALKGGDSGPAIVTGKSAESLLIQLVAGTDPDRIMPQKGERLTSQEIGLLRAWIDQGAPWPDDPGKETAPLDWWSLKPILKKSPPAVTNKVGPIAHPIDGFILAKLTEHGSAATLAPGADRRTLIRRVYFDLVGLPPVPEDVAAFEGDSSPDAYERLVEGLLASPRYGERWARHWMDVAHFAETHGHDQDRIREHAWPYRDYLIRSFNADKPYSRFVEEQVAGDALYPDAPEAIEALGFLAAGPWDESSLRDIREDTLDREIGRYLDRDDVVTTVMQTFVSSTVQCARCHDHKFDPIPQSDYYALQAVFAGVDKANRRYDADPSVHHVRSELQAKLARVKRRDREYLLSVSTQRAATEWAARLAAETAWHVLNPEVFLSSGGATLTRQPDRSLLASGMRPDKDTYMITASSPITTITAIRVEVLADDSLPKRGPGRQDNGNVHLNEIQVQAFEPGSETGRVVRLVRSSADFNQEGWTIGRALDADEKTSWGIFPRVGERHYAVFEPAEKLALSPNARLTCILKQVHGGGHLIGRVRLSVTDVEATAAIAIPNEIRAILAKAPESLTDDERLELAQFHQRDTLERELASLPPPQLVYAAASDFEPDGGHKPSGKPRMVHILHRGDIRRARQEAAPGTLECVTSLPARFTLAASHDERERRAALARWLTNRDNPLTWRSIVNRVWHYHFGRGIVDSPNDLGRMGGTPSHPELLDWLAAWFRDDGGSLKRLHRLILTSATYRQGSDSASRDINDPDNRLLSRMNRTRLDAEEIRDAVLAVSGQLDLRMGGPSDRQFDLQPGIHVTPRIDYGKFDLDGNAGRRRSVYRFLFRTLPDPLMDALDCPAGDQLTAVRNASVTVQQALALWNSAFMARQCQHVSSRLERDTRGLEAQIPRAFQLVLGRAPTSEDLNDFAEYGRRYGLPNVCRLLFNSNEFLFVN
jgi:mono/diheme cytochrome c family protein